MSPSNRILVVEDDRHFANQLKELIEFDQNVVVLAHSGPEGIQAFERESIDFILMDLMLPNMHGIRVLEAIRVSPHGADVPVILMSAVYRSEALFSRDIRRLGVTAFLSKPFSLMDLRRKVINLLAEPDRGRASVRALLSDAAASASITGPVPRVDDPDEEDSTSGETPTAAPASGPSDPWAQPQESLSPAEPVPGNGTLSALGEDDSFLRLDTSRRLPRVGVLTPEIYVQMLTMLFHSHSSGRLRLGGEQSKTIFLLNGYPVWVQVQDPRQGLLAHLHELGLLSRPDIEPLARAAEQGENINAKLLSGQFVRPEQLEPALESFVASEVRKALSHGGGFQFAAGDDFASSIPVYETNPIRQLWAALPDCLDHEAVRKHFQDLAKRELGRTRAFNRIFGYISTRGTISSIGTALKQPRSVEELLTRFPDRDGVTVRCLWFLLHAGLVALSDSHKQSLASSSSSASASRTATSDEPSPQQVPRDAGTPSEHMVEFETSRMKSIRRPAPKPAEEDVPKLIEKVKPEEQIVHDYISRMEGSHYHFLGLAPEATRSEIDEAYQELAPRYRSHQLPRGVAPDIRRKAKELLARLLEASETLRDPGRRKAYDARLARDLAQHRRVSSLQARVTSDRLRAPSDSDFPGAATASMSDSDLLPDLDEEIWYPGIQNAGHLSERRSRMDVHDAEMLADAHTFMAQGEFDSAFAGLDKLRSRYPSDPYLLSELGWCRFCLGGVEARNVEKASEWVDLALAFQPDNVGALEVKARIQCRVGEPDDAVLALKRLIRRAPDSAWARQQLIQLDEGAAKTLAAANRKPLWRRQK